MSMEASVIAGWVVEGCSFTQRVILQGFWEMAGNIVPESLVTDPEFGFAGPCDPMGDPGAPIGFCPQMQKWISGELLEFWAQNREACEVFADVAGDPLGVSALRTIGENYLLDRDGHGDGFWAGGIGWATDREDAGDALHAICERLGDFDWYLGDDRLIRCVAYDRAKAQTEGGVR